MAKTNWQAGDTVQPGDMNDIGQEINQLRTDIDNIDVPPASLTQAGIVMLSNSTNGTRENVAPTEKALSLVMQEAQAGKQAGIERKNEVVAALNSIGIPATTAESWDSLIGKMAAIIRATGNAGPAQVLSGYTFSNASGNNQVGAMPKQASGARPASPDAGYGDGAGNLFSKVPPGYFYEDNVYISSHDPDFVAGNLPKDVYIFGLVGVLERMTTADKQAIADAITSKGVSASVNDANTILAQKIGQIVTGKRFVQGSFNTDSTGKGSVSGLPFRPRLIVLGVDNSNAGGSLDTGVYCESPTTRTTIINYAVNMYNRGCTLDAFVVNNNGFVFSSDVGAPFKYNYIALE